VSMPIPQAVPNTRRQRRSVASIADLARRSPALSFFLLAFAISWGGTLLAIGGSGGMAGTTPDSDPRFVYAFFAMLAGPCIAGIGMTALLNGRAGLGEYRLRLFAWRRGLAWYATAILAAPLLMMATLLVLSAGSDAFVPGILTAENKTTFLLIGLGVGLGAGIFEELGWTGFAIPTVLQRHGVLTTGLTVGVLWSAWHLLPNSVWAAEAAAGELSASAYLMATGVGVFVGYLTAFRILMVWVYRNTQSILLGMIMHTSFTTSLLVLGPTGISGRDLFVFSFSLAAALWVAVGVGAVVMRRGGTRHPDPAVSRAR
jgi:uncharacterized protein